MGGPALPEVVEVGRSLDAVEALRTLDAPTLLVAHDPSDTMLAVLSVVVRGSRHVRAIAGAQEDVATVIDDVRASLPPGRLVLASEWKSDRTCAMFGRRGLTTLGAPSPADRPRTLAESPEIPSESVHRALAAPVDLRRYPPTIPERTVRAAARRHDWPEDGVVVTGGGSLALLGRVLRVLTDPGEAIGVHFPAFHGVLDACRREGRVARVVPEPPGESGLPKLTGIASQVRLVIVASPNAIDSREFSSDSLEAVRAALGPGRVLVLDEAYAGFTDDALVLVDSPDLAPVVRLRSLSKLDGLAGLRVGYALTTPALAGLLRRDAQAYELLEWQERAAVAALEDVDHRRRVRETLHTLRPLLVNGLESLGFRVDPSRTHLVLAWPDPVEVPFWEHVVESRGLPMEPSADLEGAFQLAVMDAASIEALLAELTDAKSRRG